MRRLIYVAAAAATLLGIAVVEPYFAYNRFSSTGPYTASAPVGPGTADEGWPAGSGSAGYPLEVGMQLCGTVNGEGIGLPPPSAVAPRFRQRTTPVAVFFVTCTNHDQVRVECRGPSDCLAVEDRSVGRLLVPAFGIVLCLLLLGAAWAIGSRDRPHPRAAMLIGGGLLIVTTLAVTLTPLRAEMNLACGVGPRCYPPPTFLDLAVRLGIEATAIALALPLLARARHARDSFDAVLPEQTGL